MLRECTPACQACHTLDHKYKCPLDFSVHHALPQPGDLTDMFQRIVKDYPQYQPNILSMPNPTDEQRNNDDDDIVDGPWVIELDQLLTHDECDRLIELGNVSGYKSSTGLGNERQDGSYESIAITGRTSANAWCIGDCMNDAVPKVVEARISNVLGIPTPHSEYLQLLQYEVGQMYESHHDFIE